MSKIKKAVIRFK